MAFWESFWKILVEIGWEERGGAHKSVHSCIYSSLCYHFPGIFLILAAEVLGAQGSSPLFNLLDEGRDPKAGNIYGSPLVCDPGRIK